VFAPLDALHLTCGLALMRVGSIEDGGRCLGAQGLPTLLIRVHHSEGLHGGLRVGYTHSCKRNQQAKLPFPPLG
jgi:hypothetical protein